MTDATPLDENDFEMFEIGPFRFHVCEKGLRGGLLRCDGYLGDFVHYEQDHAIGVTLGAVKLAAATWAREKFRQWRVEAKTMQLAAAYASSDNVSPTV